MKENNVKLTFNLTSLEPVLIPYWKTVLQPVDVKIVVELPLSKEYFDNIEALSIQGFNQEVKTAQPILTLKGYKYILDQLKTISDDTNFEIESENDWSNKIESTDVKWDE